MAFRIPIVNLSTWVQTMLMTRVRGLDSSLGFCFGHTCELELDDIMELETDVGDAGVSVC